jgi:uncharacterized protein YjbI with pentapeptide repeats
VRLHIPRIDPRILKKAGVNDLRLQLKSEGIDAEQLSLLRSGTAKWNEWREANPKTPIHLGSADLSGLDMTRMRLRDASLIGTNCEKAKFDFADLSGADLSGCVLNNAHLFRTNLAEGRLVAVDCQNAYVEQASLEKTTWTFSNVTGSNFQRARLERANFNLSYLDEADCTDAFASRRISRMPISIL